ncbi:transcriptional regulator, ArsR family [Actinomyces sp. Chiba101]|uniref:DNA-binding transcriptional regulator, ArsR family n=1 Tax=Actinomyces denticolens TaxID=52767 RepID=A0ABY1I2F5_9ACTO|nr:MULTISPECIES: metalloregulator ArsR/SmtB family transcription factor [Actinomyces]BAW92381.1 transcriptional regulator, ArsR family [Actinomyces sp. Chiba101]SHI49787.1 DNA-binding transcriptional regulator, ArsR family [Actinomyces denticolens]SUU09499.1 HTH-type transcriptional repressor CzrA [Actinomyces denticolens]
MHANTKLSLVRDDGTVPRPAMSDAETLETAELAAEVFSLLADATRIRIIALLEEEGELSSGVLAERTGRSAAAVSQHLAKLRLGHVVASRNEGPRVYYRLIDEHARILVRQAVFQAQHVTGNLPADHRIGVDHD